MEKWLKSKPYFHSPKRQRQTQTVNPFSKNKAHYGKPVQLFKDSDKDGVPNVFDCKPYNKKRQDVIPPFSGSNPLNEMYSRQEWTRQQALAKKIEEERLKEYAKLQKELARLQNPTVIYQTEYYPSSGVYQSDRLPTSPADEYAEAKEFAITKQPQSKVTFVKTSYTQPKTKEIFIPGKAPLIPSKGGTIGQWAKHVVRSIGNIYSKTRR